MFTHIRVCLRAAKAQANQSFDSIVALWSRLPDEQEPTSSDTVVLAIFASASGISIVGAVTLIAMVPR
jgi:hypothetical protein